ncbi:MAG: M23 family metallopeptidase [Clostridia bacterium]|nr:M23 family metallopeptidase [Clostridia bacterium]
MGRNLREQRDKRVTDQILIYASIAIAIISILLICVYYYSKNFKEKSGTINFDEITSISEGKSDSNNNLINDEIESASSEIGKKVNEATEEIEEDRTDKANTDLNTNDVKPSTTIKNESTSNLNVNKTSSNTNNKEKTEEQAKKEFNFEMPVDGEVVKQFARDNLVYSDTLEEWVTHLGVDIEAEKTTVVKSAEEGTIKSIKNDPRYGLTILIDHGDGYQTMYSNLLSSEFVVEGENVKKGQTIGTVGNTAAFESVDAPHLHFELIKDSVQLDPMVYLK